MVNTVTACGSTGVNYVICKLRANGNMITEGQTALTFLLQNSDDSLD